MEWMIEAVLIVLLAATLFHAVRLERALGALKRDRTELQELVSGFNASTQAAEQGIGRLRATADGAGRSIAGQIEAASGLREDLRMLTERGERVADRLEGQVRAGRLQVPDGAAEVSAPRINLVPPAVAPTPAVPPRSQAERDLLKALRIAR